MAADESGRRQLTLVFSAFMLCYNAIFLLCILCLYDNLPSGFSASLTLYFSVAAILCLLGLIGTIQQRQTYVDIFANHVLLDALLTTLPRVIFCAFLSSLPRALCAPSDFPNPFRPPTSPSLLSAADVGTSSTAAAIASPTRCFVLMNTLMGVAAFMAVASGVAQWSVALRVREYARSLRDSEFQDDKAGEVASAAGEEWRSADEEKRAMSLA